MPPRKPIAPKRRNYAPLTPAENDALAELRELLAPEAPRSIAALAELRDTATRCATRERSASRLLVMYYNSITLPARLEAEVDDGEANVTVVINQSDVDAATARAMAIRAQRLAQAKQSS